jgi:hypothetical protein
MKNYFGAIFTLLYVLCYLVVGPWDASVDYVLAGVLLFTTGIPHGAGDHLIAQKIASRENIPFT